MAVSLCIGGSVSCHIWQISLWIGSLSLSVLEDSVSEIHCSDSSDSNGETSCRFTHYPLHVVALVAVVVLAHLCLRALRGLDGFVNVSAPKVLYL